MSEPVDKYTSVPNKEDYKEPPKEKSFWEKTKKFGKKVYKEVSQPLLQGTQNVIEGGAGLVGVDLDMNISDLPTYHDISLEDNFKDDVSFQTYLQLGKLAKLKEDFGENSEENVKQYHKNLKHLLIDQMGYKGVKRNRRTGVYYVVDKDNKLKELNKKAFATMISDALGDKYELFGAMAGALTAEKYAKGSPMVKLGAGLLGAGIGAGAGSVADLASNIIDTGQELTTKQKLNEVNKAMAMELGAGLGGALAIKTGGAVLKVAGKTLKAPKQAYDLILNGNIDGAKKILKSDLKLTDDEVEEAFTQLQASQKESYGDGLLKAKEKKQEELLASAMAHPQGRRIVKEAVTYNPKASFELEQSIDQRAKSVLDGVEGVDGTTIKKAVDNYESKVKKQYADMRDNFKEALKETDYRFDLDSLGLDKTLDDLSSRVADPIAKEKFKGMVGAVENIVEQSKNGKGVERDIDSLLDIRQMMNRFYRKNKNAFDLAPDKRTFREMIGNIDKEIDNALEKVENPQLKEQLLKSFDDAREAYKEFYDVADTNLYKTLMAEGKSAEERVNALLKHAKDDAGEFQALLKNLDPTEAEQIEQTIVKSILEKNSIGKAGEMKAIDYAKVVDEFEKLKPFIKNENTLESMRLVEEMNNKFRHDFELAKVVKRVTADSPSGGIATTAEGRMKAAGAKRLFDYIQTMIPFSDGAKRLALQRHIGKALERSRTPVEMARKLANNPQVPKEMQSSLRELIKQNNILLRAKNDKAKEEALKAMDEIKAKEEALRVAKEQEIKEFKTPPLEELRTVEKLYPDDRTATMARTIRTIQEGKATEADVKRYLEAKESIHPKKLEKFLNKEKLAQMATRYRDVGEEQVKELETLRDFIMSKEGVEFSSVVNPQKFKALIYDLKTKGVPRSLEYDEIYKDLRKAYDEFKDDIQKAYGDDIDEPLGFDGKPLFGLGAVGVGLGATTEASRADESLDKMLKIDDIYDEEIGSMNIPKRIEELNQEIDFAKNNLTGVSEEDRASTVRELERLRDDYQSRIDKPYGVLLELIANGEGTSKEKALKRGYKSEYDVTLGYGAYVDDKSKPITSMTLSEVLQTQRKMLRNKKNRWNSSAVGKYQITRRTLRDLMKKLKLKGNELFTPELQDKMAIELLKRRGLEKFENGKISLKDFHNRISKEWASVARHGSDKGSYGQHVGTDSEALASVLSEIRNA